VIEDNYVLMLLFKMPMGRTICFFVLWLRLGSYFMPL